MKCAWNAFISLLPVWMRQEVDRQGSTSLLELRLRLNEKPELVCLKKSVILKKEVTKDDLVFCINAASRYSPWSAATAAKGYITAQGGHRIGICGEVTVSKGIVTGIGLPTSLCLRVARDFPGIAADVCNGSGSILIIGSPGCGKTTFLRDCIRQISDTKNGSIAVVDERGELFPHIHNEMCFHPGKRTDVMTGCSKSQGIEMLLRCMGPQTIAVDEITAQQDCDALLHACWCGVRLLATAHAKDKHDLFSRVVYKPIIASQIFHTLIVLRQDKSWYTERMTGCI